MADMIRRKRKIHIKAIFDRIYSLKQLSLDGRSTAQKQRMEISGSLTPRFRMETWLSKEGTHNSSAPPSVSKWYNCRKDSISSTATAISLAAVQSKCKNSN